MKKKCLFPATQLPPCVSQASCVCVSVSPTSGLLLEGCAALLSSRALLAAELERARCEDPAHSHRHV